MVAVCEIMCVGDEVKRAEGVGVGNMRVKY